MSYNPVSVKELQTSSKKIRFIRCENGPFKLCTCRGRCLKFCNLCCHTGFVLKEINKKSEFIQYKRVNNTLIVTWSINDKLYEKFVYITLV